eukprot:10280-Heterococcus_DN1.PRE.4
MECARPAPLMIYRSKQQEQQRKELRGEQWKQAVAAAVVLRFSTVLNSPKRRVFSVHRELNDRLFFPRAGIEAKPDRTAAAAAAAVVAHNSRSRSQIVT